MLRWGSLRELRIAAHFLQRPWIGRQMAAVANVIPDGGGERNPPHLTPFCQLICRIESVHQADELHSLL